MKKGTSALALAIVVAVAGCGFAADTPKAPGVGDQIVDFQLKSVDGKDVKTADLRKDKVLLLKFGATWCGWCNKQIPHLNKVVKEYAGKVAVLDVDVREPADKVKEHNQKNSTTYTTVLDPDGKAAGKYGVRGIPVVIVAGKDGKIAYSGYYTDFEKLKVVIDVLLKEPEPK